MKGLYRITLRNSLDAAERIIERSCISENDARHYASWDAEQFEYIESVELLAAYDEPEPCTPAAEPARTSQPEPTEPEEGATV